MNKAIFLDRDGVLNKTIIRNGRAQAPYTLEEFELCEGVDEGIKLLREAGFHLVGVTNQPDVARGWVERSSVDLINNQIQKILKLDDMKVCFHVDQDKCECRKPRPGMLLEAAKERNIDLKTSFMIGDRFSDISAGVAAGCTSLLIGDGDNQGNHPAPKMKFSCFLDAVKWILQF